MPRPGVMEENLTSQPQRARIVVTLGCAQGFCLAATRLRNSNGRMFILLARHRSLPFKRACLRPRSHRMCLHWVGVLGLAARTPPVGCGALCNVAGPVRLFLPCVGFDPLVLRLFGPLHRTNALTGAHPHSFPEPHVEVLVLLTNCLKSSGSLLSCFSRPTSAEYYLRMFKNGNPG